MEMEKVATKSPSPEAVDAILSLGHLTKDTLTTFIQNIDYFKHVESLLAKMLLLARLGMEGADEEVIESALKALNETIENIESGEAEKGVLQGMRTKKR